MAEKHKKSKNDTWTNEELSSALEEQYAKEHKRKSESRKSRASAGGTKHDLNGVNEEEKSKRNREEREKKKLSREHEREKSLRKKPDWDSNPSSSRFQSIANEEEAKRLEKERKRQERKENRRSKTILNEDDEKARRREERRENRSSRTDVSEDPEREQRRKDKEERRRRREEEKQKEEEREARRREKEERRKRREEQQREYEDTNDMDVRRREKEERRRRREEKRLEEESLTEEEIKRREKEERRRKRKEEKRREEELREQELSLNQQTSRSGGSSAGFRDEKRESERELRRREKERREKHRDSRARIEDEDNRGKEQRSKKSSKTKVSERKKAEIVVNTERRKSFSKNDEDDYNYDDEEFEDYEDDFEDSDDDEGIAKDTAPDVRDIIQAMRFENQRVASARTASSRSERSERSVTPVPERNPSPNLGMTRIDFFVARKTAAGSKVVKNMLKRRNDLSNVIQLDVIAFELFDLAPVTEYSFYIKSFGTKNTRQCSTQCNDDALEVETQTDNFDLVEKWTQHPQDGAFACGGVYEDSGSSHIEAMLESMQKGSQRFTNFLNYAGGLMDAAFAENRVYSGKKEREGSILSCCESCVKYNTNLAYLEGRQILHVVFGEGGMMAVAFGLPRTDSVTRLDTKGLVTVWKETNTDQPDKILVCDAIPVTCCFVPKKKHLLFVGTDDGSVLVFDLNEPSNVHVSRQIEKNIISVLRCPTYTTGFQNKLHTNPIVLLNPVGTFQFSNQIFSLDEAGRICIWTVVDTLSDVDDDLGLSPYGRVKLLKTTPIDVKTAKGTISQGLGVRATCAICPDATVFYVGLESGSVLSLTRERRLNTYQSQSVGDVTAVAIGKLNPSLLLVSYSDGVLALFQLKQEVPLVTWSVGRAIFFCDWSNCRSSVFFALDSTNHLHVWDFMKLDSGPVVSDLFQHKISRLSVDVHSKGTTDLIVAYESCSFEVHRVAAKYTDSVASDETERMVSLLTSFG